MGSVAQDNSAFISTFRVQANEYQNPDVKMMKIAFDFAVGLLQSDFQEVELTESSASVTYEEGGENEPHEVVTAEKINAYLTAAGYQRRMPV